VQWHHFPTAKNTTSAVIEDDTWSIQADILSERTSTLLGRADRSRVDLVNVCGRRKKQLVAFDQLQKVGDARQTHDDD